MPFIPVELKRIHKVKTPEKFKLNEGFLQDFTRLDWVQYTKLDSEIGKVWTTHFFLQHSSKQKHCRVYFFLNYILLGVFFGRKKIIFLNEKKLGKFLETCVWTNISLFWEKYPFFLYHKIENFKNTFMLLSRKLKIKDIYIYIYRKLII